ncbi:hypothetical protein HYU20_01105 [Candidatus Woesearchaeota archaeon]|nr:hypothetical protein [Candidatus Woesearchaeota archaeon]
MGFGGELFEGVGKAFIFERFRPKLRSYLSKSGIADVPYSYMGLVFWLSIVPVAYIFIFMMWRMIVEKTSNPILQFFFAVLAWTVAHGAVLAAIMLATYLYLDLSIFNRTKRMEAVLPDFLRLVSENLKGGMPFEKSLWSAIKPEFGILSQEVRLAAKKVMTGADIDIAISEFTGKYDSPMLKRSFDLILRMSLSLALVVIVIVIVIVIRKGNYIPNWLFCHEISAVIVIVIVVTPGLFTLSFQFLTILQGLGERISASGAGSASASLPIKFGSASLPPEAFKDFSRYALMVLSVFASMIVSLISKGSIKGGIKFLPFLFIGSQVVYLVAMKIGTSVFAGFFA